MDLGLANRHAVVAGAGKGIGKAIAIQLASEGADVVVASRTMKDLEQTAQEIESATGRRAIPIAFDATNREQVDSLMAKAAEALGSLHILVNSASYPGGSSNATGPIDSVEDEALLADFDVKYVGALRCARAAIPYMKEQGWGRIINISGNNARIAGNLSGGARNVSLVHLTKTLSTQMGRFGITVNCIHPGTTRTERTPEALADEAARSGITVREVEERDYAPGAPRGNSICRMVDASEVAYLAAFLASDKSWAITGEVISATGGTGNAVFY